MEQLLGWEKGFCSTALSGEALWVESGEGWFCRGGEQEGAGEECCWASGEFCGGEFCCTISGEFCDSTAKKGKEKKKGVNKYLVYRNNLFCLALVMQLVNWIMVLECRHTIYPTVWRVHAGEADLRRGREADLRRQIRDSLYRRYVVTVVRSLQREKKKIATLKA